MKKIILCLAMLFITSTVAYTKTLTINLSSPTGSQTLSVVIASPAGNVSESLQKSLVQAFERDLQYIPFMKILRQYKVSYTPGSRPNFVSLSQSNINLLITTSWSSSGSEYLIDVQIFDILSRTSVVSRKFKIANERGIQGVADASMSALLEHLIGDGSLFSTRIFFAMKEGPIKQTLWSILPNGTGLKKETDILGLAISPSVSSDGRYITFTHIDRRRHTLALFDRKTKQVRRVVYPQGASVISPTFMPSGDIAVSLSFKGRGNPSIYRVSGGRLSREEKLMGDGTINVSPSFSPAVPNIMVYTSSKFGNPQIFMKNLTTGVITRISKDGRYNTDPVLSPDGRYIAYVSMLKEGRRIFVYDIETKKNKQVTFGPRDDDTPEFAPDSYFIAFISTRSGKAQLYLTTREGTGAVLIPARGNNLSDPTWGLAN
ncbi:MAG: hypothetical protein K2M30_03665 [Desulfovibrionaceae bacterium]|nr:hypothetical protein [Desulfovibrionaceae bacterium]